jgi:hypothetical protein
MPYYIRARSNEQPSYWRKLNTQKPVTASGWNVMSSFVDSGAAKTAFHEWEDMVSLLSSSVEYAIVDDDHVIIWSNQWGPEKSKKLPPLGVHSSKEGEDVTPDLDKPLTIKRTVLIAKLQENLDKEVAKREEAEAAEEKGREDVLAAIAAFTPDELYNIFAHNYSTKVETLKFDKDQKSWVTKDVIPTARETDLEKFVRVLGIASDADILLKPNQELYGLL